MCRCRRFGFARSFILASWLEITLTGETFGMKLTLGGVIVAGGMLPLVAAFGHFARGQAANPGSQSNNQNFAVSSTVRGNGAQAANSAPAIGGPHAGVAPQAVSPGLRTSSQPRRLAMVNVGLKRRGHHEGFESPEGRERGEGGE